MSFVGIDIGGTGSRVRVVDDAGAISYEARGAGTRIEHGGSAVPALAMALIDDVRRHATSEVRAVGLGATGLATLVADPAALAADLRSRLGGGAGVAVAIDAVTAHRGALNGAAGAVIAVGTGAVALGTDHRAIWRRVDGWGHLLGDRGSGSWLGRRGLEEAARAYDGVDAAGAELLVRARHRFGEVSTWPSQLYTRDDRAGVLAGFARDVLDAAAEDSCAARIVDEAAEEAARSAVAALGDDLPEVVVLTGGVAFDERYARAFAAAVSRIRPGVRVHPAVGDPLDGAVALARALAAGDVRAQPGFLWT